MLETQLYFSSPVEVVRVTKENIHEVAEWCGGSVHETESRFKAGRMDKYVWVPTPKGSNLAWAFPGMFVTRRIVIQGGKDKKTSETWAVFRTDYFAKNYFEDPKKGIENTWAQHRPEVAKAYFEKNAPQEPKKILSAAIMNAMAAGASMASPKENTVSSEKMGF